MRLATRYGRYGYRRIRRLLLDEGWHVSVKRVYRIWRREGLKVPKKQPKRGRLWLNDGSCIRLRPERPNHVWSYDFMQDRTEDGRRFRMLTVIDEYTRRCLAIVVARKLRSDDVLHCLTELFVAHRPPEHIRSDNGPEFIARNVREWLGRIGVKTLFIEPGSPWENGYCESFNSKLRDELLAGEQFSTLHEAKVLIEHWRRHYNAIRPHSSLGYRPPAPETVLPTASALPYAALRSAQTPTSSGRTLTYCLVPLCGAGHGMTLIAACRSTRASLRRAKNSACNIGCAGMTARIVGSTISGFLVMRPPEHSWAISAPALTYHP